MWPCYRLVRAGWATVTELSTSVTRERVIEMNELLDAFEEAEDAARAKQRGR